MHVWLLLVIGKGRQFVLCAMNFDLFMQWELACDRACQDGSYWSRLQEYLSYCEVLLARMGSCARVWQVCSIRKSSHKLSNLSVSCSLLRIKPKLKTRAQWHEMLSGHYHPVRVKKVQVHFLIVWSTTLIQLTTAPPLNNEHSHTPLHTLTLDA